MIIYEGTSIKFLDRESRLIGGVPDPDGVGMVGRIHLRAYDLVTPGTDET